MSSFSFKMGKRLAGTLGRAGVISTPHGQIKTPAFVVVGDDDLVWGAGLVEEGEDGLFEVVRLVEGGDTYGEGEGAGHQGDCNGRVIPSPTKVRKVFEGGALGPDQGLWTSTFLHKDRAGGEGVASGNLAVGVCVED